METMGEVIGKGRRFQALPFPNPRLYAYFASLVAPVPALISRALLESYVNEATCQDSEIRNLVPFDLKNYRETVLKALLRENLKEVTTRWSDAYPRDHSLTVKLHELTHPPLYISSYSIFSSKKDDALFNSVCSIGGDNGWFNSNFMWKLRGMADRLLNGVGSSRGRKSSSTLRVNDVIDFWRVESLLPNKLLRLRAEMKLPGLAWLEFSIKSKGKRNQLTIKAYFKPLGVWGKLYWYAFLPFHHFIFNDLIKQIEANS